MQPASLLPVTAVRASVPRGSMVCRVVVSVCLLAVAGFGVDVVAADSDAAGTDESTTLSRREQKHRQIGEQMHQQIIARHGIYRDAELQAYVRRIGERLAAHSDKPDIDYRFTVLDDPIVNAFAVLGGFIYVTRGMLAHMNSESELAAVLGHELAHITERHSVRSRNRGQALNVLSGVAAIATGVPGVYDLGDLAGDLYLKGYSRSFELEADEVGAEIMARAGYSPDAMLRTLEILKNRDRMEIGQAREEGREPRIYHGILSTHPDKDRRYREAIKAAEKIGARYQETVTGDQFLQKLNGMAYGPRHQTGVLRGDRFFYPRFNFKMSIPETWRQKPVRSGVMFEPPTGDAALRVAVGRLQSGLSLRQSLEAMGYKLREGNDITVAGLPAWLGIADQGASPFGPRPLRLALLADPQRRVTYLIEGSGKHDLRRIANDGDFIASIFSFDFMNRDDFRMAKVPTVQVVRAEADTTFAELAAASPLPNYAENTLRLLNGMYGGGEPQPGQLVKVIQ